METELVRKASDWVCAIIVKYSWIVVVEVGVTIDASGHCFIVALLNWLRTAEVQAEPAITRRAWTERDVREGIQTIEE